MGFLLSIIWDLVKVALRILFGTVFGWIVIIGMICSFFSNSNNNNSSTNNYSSGGENNWFTNTKPKGDRYMDASGAWRGPDDNYVDYSGGWRRK